MDKSAVLQASQRLEKARIALNGMRSAASPELLESCWLDFLHAASSFYSKLEQGAKPNSKSKQWFAVKKHERRKDDLLRYIHQARNADEHGIRRIVKTVNSRILLHPGAEVTLRSDGQEWHIDYADGVITFPNDAIALVKVHDDRYGDSFDPPKIHRGSQVPNTSPITVAELAIVYLNDMLLEAMDL